MLFLKNRIKEPSLVTDEAYEILNRLQRYGIEFHPTGSQVFGKVTEDSDLDVFISADNLIKVLLLVDAELRQLYQDSNARCVLSIPDARLHIQIVRDYAAKLAVQDTILRLGLDHHKREVWNQLYTLYAASRTPVAFEADNGGIDDKLVR